MHSCTAFTMLSTGIVCIACVSSLCIQNLTLLFYAGKKQQHAIVFFWLFTQIQRFNYLISLALVICVLRSTFNRRISNETIIIIIGNLFLSYAEFRSLTFCAIIMFLTCSGSSKNYFTISRFERLVLASRPTCSIKNH